MKILQSGYPKSGNYWLYQILKNICQTYNLERKGYISGHPVYPLAQTWNLSYDEQVDIDMIDILYTGVFFRISSRYREKISEPQEYFSKTDHVWTHSNFCERTPEVFSYFDKKIYIIRDIRDILLSASKFAFTDYMKEFWPTWYNSPEEYLQKEAGPMAEHWAGHVRGHFDSGEGIYFVFYENLKNDLQKELKKLISYLGLHPDENSLQKIKDAVSLENLREKSPGHVRKGEFYGWKNVLPINLQLKVLDNAGDVLERLNYPVSPTDELLPHL